MSVINNITDLWNAIGTTFTAIKMNVTDTASAAGSLLMDLQVASVSKFKVGKGGDLTLTGSISQSGGVFMAGGQLLLGSDSAQLTMGGANDIRLFRNASGILGVHTSSTTDAAAIQLGSYAASPPAAPPASNARLYIDTSGGKDRLMVVFSSGAAQIVATQP